jgi:predicted nucleic acid-binding protein
LSALFDTSVVLDYLRGIKPADAAFERFQQRAITVTTWVEVAMASPVGLVEQTRDFLQTFRRIQITDAVGDRALALMERYSRLRLRHALPWAAAQVHSLVYVTADFPKLGVSDVSLHIPYRAGRRPGL